MAKQQMFTEGHNDTTKQPRLSATHPTTAKVRKLCEATEAKPRKIQAINANSYKCDDVESALAPRTAAFEGKLAKSREANGSELQNTTTTAQARTMHLTRPL